MRGKKDSIIVEIIEMIIKVITAMVACFNFIICLLYKKPDNKTSAHWKSSIIYVRQSS